MKKLVIPILTIIVLMCMPSGVYGQKNAEDPILKIFDQYEEREGVESITISPALLGLMKNGNSGDKKTQELISKISGLRILTLNADGKGRVNREREALMADLQNVVKTGFEQIMKVKNANERIELYVRHKSDCKDCMSALLFIASEVNSLTVMHLAGIIDKTLIDAVMNGEIGLSSK